MREVHNGTMRDFLRRVVPTASSVFTVCSGSAIIASTGLLDGHQATSNKLAFDLLNQV
jgi:putative intracellular protease/amidase